MANNISELTQEDHFNRAHEAYYGNSGYSGHLGMWSKMPAPQFNSTQICVELNTDRSYQDTINDYLSNGYTFVSQVYVNDHHTPIIIFQLPKY